MRMAIATAQQHMLRSSSMIEAGSTAAAQQRGAARAQQQQRGGVCQNNFDGGPPRGSSRFAFRYIPNPTQYSKNSKKKKPIELSMARPTVYKKSYCKMVVELGKAGLSKAEIAGELGVGRTTIFRWEKLHPEFREALELATEFSQAFWEKYIRGAVLGQHENVNAKLIELYMRNRFDDWNTAIRQEKTVNEHITIDHVGSIRDRIKTLTGRLVPEEVEDVEELPRISSDKTGSTD